MRRRRGCRNADDDVLCWRKAGKGESVAGGGLSIQTSISNSPAVGIGFSVASASSSSHPLSFSHLPIFLVFFCKSDHRRESTSIGFSSLPPAPASGPVPLASLCLTLTHCPSSHSSSKGREGFQVMNASSGCRKQSLVSKAGGRMDVWWKEQPKTGKQVFRSLTDS